MVAKALILFALVTVALGAVVPEKSEKAVENNPKPHATVEAETKTTDEKTKEKRHLGDIAIGYSVGYASPYTYTSYSAPVASSVHTHTHSQITKEVAVPVVHQVPYAVEKHIPYPVVQKVAVPVDRPIAIPVPKPYPVEVTKTVPVPVDRPVPYPVHVPVVKHVAAPYAVNVAEPYPVPVVKHVAVPYSQPIVYEKQHYGYSSW